MTKITVDKMKKAIAGTKFEQDLGGKLMINRAQSSPGMWNLICSIRDCKLYSKGIKPHRRWKISDVKWYFGIKGGAEKMAETLEAYKNILMPEKVEGGELK